MNGTVDQVVPDDVLANQTYAHLVARWFVRPLVGTRVRPNHLTVLRIAVGLVATLLLAVGTRSCAIASGLLWMLACLLDRADGELARLGDLRSESGKRLDFVADLVLDAAWFLGAGIGMRTGALGAAAPLLGIACCVSMVVIQWIGELYERRSAPGTRVWGATRRFHPDDGLFLLSVFVWLDLLTPILIGSALVVPIIAAATTVRYVHQAPGSTDRAT